MSTINGWGPQIDPQFIYPSVRERGHHYRGEMETLNDIWIIFVTPSFTEMFFSRVGHLSE